MSGKRPYGRSRQDLAEAAIHAFEAQGFAATTVDEIAAAAGYSPRTFHRQFPAKEDVVFHDLPDILTPLRALVGRPGPAWPAVGAVLVRNSTEWEAGDRALALSRTRLFHEDPALHRRFLEIAAEWEDVLTQVFATERGPAAARLLATTAVGAARTALRTWLDEPETTLADHMQALLDMLQMSVTDI